MGVTARSDGMSVGPQPATRPCMETAARATGTPFAAAAGRRTSWLLPSNPRRCFLGQPTAANHGTRKGAAVAHREGEIQGQATAQDGDGWGAWGDTGSHIDPLTCEQRKSLLCV